jgi:DivIVA domain-containing protein
MSSTEPDRPIVVSAEQVRRREFATIRRGYDPDQVRDYLEQVAVQVERMEQIAREARLEVEAAHHASLTPRADVYEEFASRMSDLLRAADEQADRVRSEAKEEADRILTEVRADADRIRLDALSKAEESRTEGERAVREARERADRSEAGLASKRENLLEQLQSMQERLLSVARDLEATVVPKGETTKDADADVGAKADHGLDPAAALEAGDPPEQGPPSAA